MQNIEEIYKEYFNAINKYLFCLTNNKDISEELTQETFYKAVQKIDKYKEEYDISAWLCKIAKNLWYDQCRKNKKLKVLAEEKLIDIEDINELEKKIILKEEKIGLYKKMQNIDETSREVIYLRITGELTFKEIGIILNKTENWARTTFYRAKQKLKEGDYYEGE